MLAESPCGARPIRAQVSSKRFAGTKLRAVERLLVALGVSYESVRMEPHRASLDVELRVIELPAPTLWSPTHACDWRSRRAPKGRVSCCVAVLGTEPALLASLSLESKAGYTTAIVPLVRSVRIVSANAGAVYIPT